MVDSRASVHMVSEKDLHSAELETMRTSRSPTTVMTAIGEVRTNKGATVYHAPRNHERQKNIWRINFGYRNRFLGFEN